MFPLWRVQYVCSTEAEAQAGYLWCNDPCGHTAFPFGGGWGLMDNWLTRPCNAPLCQSHIWCLLPQSSLLFISIRMYTFIYDILEYKCIHLYDILEYKMYTFIYDILEYKMYIQCTVNVPSTMAMCSNFYYCLYIS